MQKRALVCLSALPFAITAATATGCNGTAIVDGVAGGQGGAASSSANATGGNRNGQRPAEPSSTSISVAVATAGSGGASSCVGCADFLFSDDFDTFELCGYLGMEEGGDLICEPTSDCQIVQDIKECACDAETCLEECSGSCAFSELQDGDCADCVLDECTTELNACIR